MSYNRTDSQQDNTCVVCFKTVDLFSVGICDHPVCFECSTRMRVLCNQLECPICRRELPKVIFTKEVQPYAILKTKAESINIHERRYGMYFMSRSIQNRYYQLLDHECFICKRIGINYTFRNFQYLKDHMRKHHELFYCDLCVANLRIFTFERKCYNRTELGLHRRKGDVDNTSHRGHPLCEFCDERFMDKDELFRHMRRDHYFCHFCDADGKHHYYNTYNDLRKHYLEEHYLCEEGDCKHEKFTSVFRTDIDLKAHYATAHGRNLGKAANRQARTLELQFTLAPRPRLDGMGRGRKNPDLDTEEEGAVGFGSYSVEPGGRDETFVNPLSKANFPTLDGNTPRVTISSLGGGGSARPSGVTITTSSSGFNPLSQENFPSLGTTGKRPAVTITRTVRQPQEVKSTPSSATSTVRLRLNNNSKQNVSIHVNPSGRSAVRPKSTEAFPALSQSTIPTPNVQWVQQKPKKPEQKISKVAPAPVLPSTSDFPKLNKKDEAKGKKNETANPSWVNLNNFNENSSKGKKAEEAKQVSVEENGEKVKKKKKEKQNSEEEPSRKVKEKNEANLPNGITKKRSELKIGALEINDASYPVLGPAQPPPPPGFRDCDYPTCGNGDPLSSDLTFTTSSGQSYAILPTNQFFYPPNFKTRNQTLIQKFIEATKKPEIIKEFKKSSVDFRNGTLSAHDYYILCKKCVKDQFNDIFFELLVLLPDNKKQRELFEAHLMLGGSGEGIEICATCQQVVFAYELRSHLLNHTLDNHFPQLNIAEDVPNAWHRK